MTLPALVNVGGLLLLLMYLYSVLGVFLFANVKKNDALNEVLNFESFPKAFITMFVLTNGNSWDMLMDATTRERSILYQCIDDPSYEDYINNDK